MTEIKPTRIAPWLAPGFLLLLVVVFLAAPWSIKDKLDAVCFGI
jgi:hypothetical protein